MCGFCHWKCILKDWATAGDSCDIFQLVLLTGCRLWVETTVFRGTRFTEHCFDHSGLLDKSTIFNSRKECLIQPRDID